LRARQFEFIVLDIVRLVLPAVALARRQRIAAEKKDRRQHARDRAGQVVFETDVLLGRQHRGDHAAVEEEHDQRGDHGEAVAAQQAGQEQEQHEAAGDATRADVHRIAREHPHAQA